MSQQGRLFSREALKSHLLLCAESRDLAAGRKTHSAMTNNVSDNLHVLGSDLINMFACCGSLLEANLVFSQVLNPCVSTWHAIVAAHAQLCQVEKAMHLYERMQQEEGLLSVNSILCLLGACSKERLLSLGRLLNDKIIRWGQSSDMAVGSSLIDMYAKCGSIEEAQKTFDNLPSRNVVTWNALIAGHSVVCQDATAVSLFQRMKQVNVKPVKVTFMSVLKACGTVHAREPGNMVYDDILRSGLEVDLAVGNTLVDFYVKNGLLQEAHKVFKTLPSRDVVSWNSIISGYAKGAHGATALVLFTNMQGEGVNPDTFSFSCVFQACGSIGDGEKGKLLHNQLIWSGLETDVVVGGTLLSMYAKCGNLDEARQVFDGLPSPNSVVWGMMIAVYTQHGQHSFGLELFKRMQDEGMKPDAATYPFVMNSCASLRAICSGRVVHKQVLSSHFETEITIGNALIDMYAKCGSMKEAHWVFNELPVKNVVSWNSLIAGYVHDEDSCSVLDLYENMQQDRVKVDKVTILSVLKACANLEAVIEGRKLHEEVCRHGLESDVVLGSSLVDMYAKSGSLEEAHAVFSRMSHQDIVSCGAMMAGYVQHDSWSPALKVYELMLEKSIKPDNVCYACILKACCSSGAVDDFKRVHDKVIRNSCERDVLIGNVLIDMYARTGRLLEAHHTFDGLSKRNLASWNAIMTGYAQHDEGFSAFRLFAHMHRDGPTPDRVSFLAILKACSSVGSIEHGLLIHNQIIKNDLESDMVIGNSIVDMYAKCGGLYEAHKTCDGLRVQNVVSWSALLAGYAQHKGLKWVRCYLHAMYEQGMKPVSKTFTSILGACSNEGQVEEGHYYFRAMKQDHGITLSIEHYNCMIDVMGRAGHLYDARKFLQSMPAMPNVTTWMSILTSCHIFGSVTLGRICFDQVMKHNPYNSSAYMIMSKIYADAHMWVEVQKLEEERKGKFAWKKPGKACLEVVDEVHEFIAGNKTVPICQEILSYKLQTYTRVLKEKGYVPLSDSVLGTDSGVVDEEAYC